MCRGLKMLTKAKKGGKPFVEEDCRTGLQNGAVAELP